MSYRADDAGSDKAATTRKLTAGTPSAVLAGLGQQQHRTEGGPPRTLQVYNVRGVPPARAGDGSEFGRALEAAGDKRVDTLLEGVDKGLSPADASVEADKALGKTDPASNFAAVNRVPPRGIGRMNREDGNVFGKGLAGDVSGFWGAVGGRFDQQTRFSPQAATLAGNRAAQIALRGEHEEVNRGDGSIFDKVLEVAANRWVAVGDAVEASGASPEEADAEANKAIGTTNPEANFAADAIEALSARAPLPGIALRGADGPQQDGPRIDPAQAGDGSPAGEVIEGLEDRENAAYKDALAGGANPNDAQAAADKAVGRADPRANFSANTSPVDATNVSRARRLATALRPSGLRRATTEGQTTPGLKIPTLGFPRFA